jgi:hypothetical protein
MLLHRRQARERLAQETRLEQREQEQARRDEEWRSRQLQLEIDRDRRNEHQALIRRLIAMRATTRDLEAFLATTLQALVDGQRVSRSDFDVHQLRTALNSAFDEALLDGLWVAHAGGLGFFAFPDGSLLAMQERMNPEQGVDVSELGRWLYIAIRCVRECVEHRRPIPAEKLQQAKQALCDASTARAALVAYIQGRLDA